jgi:hypothetical protein
LGKGLDEMTLTEIKNTLFQAVKVAGNTVSHATLIGWIASGRLNIRLLERLVIAYSIIGPYYITSLLRSLGNTSYHETGLAADIQAVSLTTWTAFKRLAETGRFPRLGVRVGKHFVHIDVGDIATDKNHKGYQGAAWFIEDSGGKYGIISGVKHGWEIMTAPPSVLKQINGFDGILPGKKKVTPSVPAVSPYTPGPTISPISYGPKQATMWQRLEIFLNNLFNPKKTIPVLPSTTGFAGDE